MRTFNTDNPYFAHIAKLSSFAPRTCTASQRTSPRGPNCRSDPKNLERQERDLTREMGTTKRARNGSLPISHDVR